ncbi:MAG: (p)ppGpp synthetase, partial [Bacillota bacterium]|nr:(p)ppGpp synthetase [Bacillota bacterium]
CTPVPGDEIVGYITKGRGITVHRQDCDNLKSLPPEEQERFIEVSWDSDILNKSFEGEICIIASDQKGMLSSISKVCEDNDVNISGLNARANKDETFRIDIMLSINDRTQLEKIIRSFKSIPGIIDAYRTKG